MADSSSFHPLDQDAVFERPTSSKAQARQARRLEKANKALGQAIKPLVAKNDNQRDYIDCLDEKESVLAIGPAGVGKTYIAGRKAAQRMVKGEIEKIIVSRVTVSKREHALGFLPGNIDAKMKPWMTPIIEGIRAEVSGSTLDKWKAEGKFEIVPFEYMRGRSFDNCVIILDEAQNATVDDLKLFLTRTGEDSQVIVCGDPDQVDIPNSGLNMIVDLADQFQIMDIIEFTEDDVVRSKFAKAWVQAFSALKREKAVETALDSSMSFMKQRSNH